MGFNLFVTILGMFWLNVPTIENHARTSALYCPTIVGTKLTYSSTDRNLVRLQVLILG
jgi:hypothetical protein